MNDNADIKPFTSYSDARTYARDHISYSGGRIKKVVLTDLASDSAETLWQHDWDEVSKIAGLSIRN